MAKPDALAPRMSPFDELRLLEDHRPALEDGDFVAHVDHEVTFDGQPTHFKTENMFSVFGNRFDLPPDAFTALFPPSGARGDFWRVFPHVVLSRSTLPWERSACDDASGKLPPWLALLVFDEEEELQVIREIRTLKDLSTSNIAYLADTKSSPDGAAHWPGIDLESAQHEDDLVHTICAPLSVLNGLLPTNRADMAYRTHTRQITHPMPQTVFYLAEGIVQAAADNLKNIRDVSALEKFFLLAGLKLGDRLRIRCRYDEKAEHWVFTDPTIGEFSLTTGKDISGVWLRATGQSPVTGQPGGTPKTYDFGGIDASGDTIVALLNDGNLPAAFAPTLANASRFIITTDSGASAKSRGQGGGQNWRGINGADDQHILISMDKGGMHTRLTLSNYGEPQSEVAVVVANRLPQPGKKSTAHLVSLENRFVPTKEDCVFQTVGLGPNDMVRLVSLKTWDFYSENSRPLFKGLCENLNLLSGAEAPPLFHLPPMSSPNNDGIDTNIAAGMVPLTHNLRTGGRLTSWYQGPLVPKIPSVELKDRLPTHAADALLIYDGDQKMFNTSYAAAWQLGRLATLANTDMALQILEWKRAHRHQLNSARHIIDLGSHIPLHADHLAESEAGLRAGLPAQIDRWFEELSLLQHVPFRYLVPHDDLLPMESLRFFEIDTNWISSLLDGAFSIGRVHAKDTAKSENQSKHVMTPRKISGFLMRSELIKDYPNLNIDAYAVAVGADGDERLQAHLSAEKSKPLTCLRRADLGQNVLLCLYDGAIEMVDMHLKPDILHFGLDDPHAHLSDAEQRDPHTLVKDLRRADGTQIHKRVLAGTSEGSLQIDHRRIVDFTALSAAIKLHLGSDLPDAHLPAGSGASPVAGLNPAIFALEMLTAVDLVRFSRRDTESERKS